MPQNQVNKQYNNCVGKSMSKKLKVKYKKLKKGDLLKDYNNQNNKYNKLLKEISLGNKTIAKQSIIYKFPKFKSVKIKNRIQSLGEFKVELYLKNKSIQYITEVQFKGCINPKTKRNLRYDFFIEKLGVCIEFDGEQHFKQIKEFDGDDNGLAFRKRKELDKIKNNFCINNKIKLFRISYKDIDNIDKILCSLNK